LIHGQVVVAWGHRFNPARIWVVDDAAAADPLEREVFEGRGGRRPRQGRPRHRSRGCVHERERRDRRRVPARARSRDRAAARRSGAPVARYNVGGLHYSPGKHKVNEYVYLDDADRAAARALLGRGIALEVQDVPASRSAPLESLAPEVRSA
jgi:mannose/fructose/N-acetylgalactosamine-specific phosphotransferase system component IIB